MGIKYGLVSKINKAFIKPIKLKYADGGTLLSLRVQSALMNQRNVIRIDSKGIVTVNSQKIGSSYGTINLGKLMHEKDREKREIIIVAEKSVNGKNVEAFISGLNTGSIPRINQLQGCGMVFTKDLNLLTLLYESNVPVIKVNPNLNFTNKELLKIYTFFMDNLLIMRDFRSFTSEQRAVILKLLQRELIGGLFNFWGSMDPKTRTSLLDHLSGLDVELVDKNLKTHRNYIITNSYDNSSNYDQIKGNVSLPDLDAIPEMRNIQASKLKEYVKIGDAYKTSRKLGVVVMAAGAAQRFGQGPKALIKVGDRTFMRIAAEDVLKASRKAKHDIPLFVMVSLSNGEAIKEHFSENGYFGLKQELVFFFYQTDTLPKIYKDCSLALNSDKTGLDFAPTGHGFAVKGIKENVLPICGSLGVKTLFIRNIDNLGATNRDESYEEVLGYHIISRSPITVELVKPKIGIDKTDGKKIPLDHGGGVLSLDCRNVLVEDKATPDSLKKSVIENPFNTLSITIETEAFEKADPKLLPWYITHKKDQKRDDWRRYQFEQFLGDITHQIQSSFVIVEREGKKGRFIPVKEPKDLDEAIKIFNEMEKQKD